MTTTYPPELDQAIIDQNNTSIISDFLIPTIKLSHTTNNLTQLYSIITRLLDPDQEYDEIIEPEDLIKISIGCVQTLTDLLTNSKTDNDRIIAYRIQGIIAWIGTSQTFIILGDLVQHEKQWQMNPIQDFIPHNELSDIILSIQPLLTSFNFIPSTIREKGRKFHEFPLLYNLSYVYLSWISGLLGLFNNRYMESINSLINTNSSAQTIITHILSTFPTATPLLHQSTSQQQQQKNNNDMIQESNINQQYNQIMNGIDVKEQLPGNWLSCPKIFSFLKKAQLDSFITTIKIAPILPINTNKGKLLGNIVTNELFTTHRSVIDQYFYTPKNKNLQKTARTSSSSSSSNCQFDSFPLLISDHILYKQTDKYDAQRMTSFSYCNCIEKLSSNRSLSKFDIIFIAAINKTPVKTLQHLIYPQEAFTRLQHYKTNKNGEEKGGMIMSDDISAAGNGAGSDFIPFPSCPSILPLIQHNIIIPSTYTTTISLKQLCIILGLDPNTHTETIRDVVRIMINENLFFLAPSSSNSSSSSSSVISSGGGGQSTQLSKLNTTTSQDTISFLQLTNNPLPRIEATMGSRSDFLRCLYDAAIDGGRYDRIYQQQQQQQQQQ